MKTDQLTLGVCYYPEHWDKSFWEKDLSFMKETGIEIVRIGEFAWNMVEPEDGEFTYDFFDEFLDLAQQYGIKVIYGTPTATPPAWLTRKYPEILNVSADGIPFYHGNRRHYTYNSTAYNQYVTRIVEKIAQHYCPHPAIIGWQIDNELNCGVNTFYSECDHEAFREFLKEKYETLDTLNKNWGTVFWNQTYSDWDEIFLPRNQAKTSPNPHLALDEKRFISKSTIRFCKMQADIIRQYIDARQFITTNGIFGHVDNNEMVNSCLDFITYDSYPNFAYGNEAKENEINPLKDRKWSRHLTLVRSFSSNFGVMEQQSGPGGWVDRMVSPSPKPGQMMLWTFQSVAHGADFISYFRWRTASFGIEIYWHGLLNYDSQPNRRIDEL